MNKWYAHLKTITRHKLLVMRHCFQIGLYWQGLMHDLSKYSPAEFLVGAKYYQGDRSPNDAERREKGYSSAWLHHKGRNKHHLEYWIDYTPGGDHHMGGVEMPVNYVAEMFCDRIAACKIYHGANYQDADPYEYFMRGRSHTILHKNSAALLEQMLRMLKERGETETFLWVRRELLHR